MNDAALQLMAVPSLSARQSAPVNYQPLLNAFPLPSQPALNADESLAAAGLEKQAQVQNYSVRIDQVLGDKIRLFARYSNVPSSSRTEQLDARNARFEWVSATLGMTSQWGEVTHDLHFNFSRVVNTSSWSAANKREETAFERISAQTPVQGISTPGLTISSGESLSNFLYPPSSVESLSIGGNAELVSGVGERSSQEQWEETYTFARQWGRHDIRLGADCIRLLPRTGDSGVFTTAVAVEGVGALLAGEPVGVTMSGGRGLDYYGQIYVGSTFLQDSYKVNERLTLLYGLRWEITPKANTEPYAPEFPYVGTINSGGAFDDVGFLGGASFTLPSSFTQLAPRFGLAYHFKSPDVVLRAGGGIFYDTALASLVDPVNAAPFNGWQYVPGAPRFTPALLPNPPNYSSQLSLPEVWEWRTSLERSIGEGSVLSVAYVGSAGSKLLREEAGTYPTGLLQAIDFESNGTSNYQALQTQYSGHITSRLYALMSYTLGHSIDTGSDESSVFLAQPGNSTSLDRGSSDFDVRHNANFSLSYALPSWAAGGLRRAWFGGWRLSSTLEARSGFPFDVTTVDRSVGLGFADSGRPNIVPGVPMWITDTALPGGRELNSAAFAAAPYGTTGTLGRNVLSGSGLFQMDASLRRQFRLHRASSVEVSVSAFNLLNRANFSNPVSYLGSPLFGQPTSMQNLMLGSGGPTSGITPIFEAGGPRTVELHLKFSF